MSAFVMKKILFWWLLCHVCGKKHRHNQFTGDLAIAIEPIAKDIICPENRDKAAVLHLPDRWKLLDAEGNPVKVL